MINEPLALIVLQMSCAYFCFVVSLFIVPLVVERIIYHIPRLIVLTRAGDALKQSVPMTIFGVVLWSALVVGAFFLIYSFFPNAFYYVTVAPVSLVAWGLGLIHLVYRFANFNKTVKRNFYYKSYMHYITPEALQAYQIYIEELDDMTNGQLEDQIRLGKKIPYMHRQALHRKLGERGIVEKWDEYNQKMGLFAFIRLGSKKESKRKS